MTKEEIVKYVMDTPNNSNPAVLGSMVDALIDSSGAGNMEPLEFTIEQVSYDGNSAFKIVDATFDEIVEAFNQNRRVIGPNGAISLMFVVPEEVQESDNLPPLIFSLFSDVDQSIITCFGYENNNDVYIAPVLPEKTEPLLLSFNLSTNAITGGTSAEIQEAFLDRGVQLQVPTGNNTFKLYPLIGTGPVVAGTYVGLAFACPGSIAGQINAYIVDCSGTNPVFVANVDFVYPNQR